MRLYLGGYLDFYHPQRKRWLEVELEQPVALWALLERLQIPAANVYLVVINGVMANLEDAQVSPQDEVKLFSAMDGG
jgi:sulfur carrier protein ThiS